MDCDSRFRLKCIFDEKPRVKVGIVWLGRPGGTDFFSFFETGIESPPRVVFLSRDLSGKAILNQKADLGSPRLNFRGSRPFGSQVPSQLPFTVPVQFPAPSS